MAANAFLLIVSYLVLLLVLAQPLGMGLAAFDDDEPVFAGLVGSEERRAENECRERCAQHHYKKNVTSA